MSVHKDEATGKWYYRFKYRDSNTNKRREKSKFGFNKRTDARIAEADARKLIANQEYMPNDITFKELFEEYLKYSENTVKLTTIATIKQKINKHVMSYFESKKINNISVNDIRIWQNEMNRKNYSIKYLTSIFNALTTVLNYGVKYHNLNVNVAIKNGNFKDPNTLKKEMEVWSLDEFNRFNNSIIIKTEIDLIYKVFYNFLYWTGSRRGEAKALTWEDITNSFYTITINKTCTSKIKDIPYLITPPKTKSSIRTISLPKTLILLLEELYKQEIKRDGFSKKHFVFGFDKPLSDTTIETKKNKYCELANIKKIRIHDFRHSHASLLIYEGLNIVEVAKRLGHSDISMTLNTYSHLMPNSDDKLINTLDNLM